MTVDSKMLRQAVNRLVQRLQLPEDVTDLQFHFSADDLPRITVTRLLTPAEIDEIATWYVVEGIDRVPQGTTTYDLEARPPSPQPKPPLQCDPGEQQARQDRIDALYEADGRRDPAHPAHATYSGLAQQAAARLTASPDEIEEAL